MWQLSEATLARQQTLGNCRDGEPSWSYRVPLHVHLKVGCRRHGRPEVFRSNGGGRPNALLMARYDSRQWVVAVQSFSPRGRATPGWFHGSGALHSAVDVRRSRIPDRRFVTRLQRHVTNVSTFKVSGFS